MIEGKDQTTYLITNTPKTETPDNNLREELLEAL